jgi:hypothetical protein
MPTERPPLLGEVVPTFADRGCCVVSATNPPMYDVFIYKSSVLHLFLILLLPTKYHLHAILS